MVWEFAHSQTLVIAWVRINSKTARYLSHGFLSHIKYLGVLWFWYVCLFSILFPCYGIHSSHTLENAWISISREMLKETISFWMFVFSHIFSLLCQFAYNSHVLVIVLVYRKNLTKFKSEKEIGIPIYFPWKEQKNSQISSKTHSLGTIWFSTEYFHVMGIHEFSSTLKLELKLGMVCVFPCLLYTMGIHSSHRLGMAWISASREICKKHITFECLCFFILFL